MFYLQLATIALPLIVSLISPVYADTITARATAQCVYIYPKIYCYGGRTYADTNDTAIDVLTEGLFNSLDLSEDISISDMQNRWTPIAHQDPGPNTLFAMVADPEHNAILMDGGGGLDDTNSTYRAQYRSIMYNITTESWETDIPMRDDTVLVSVPGPLNVKLMIYTAVPPLICLSSIFHSAILGPNSTAYIFGGRILQDNLLTEPATFPLEMLLFNFATSSWSTSTGVSSLRDSMVEYRAALGKDGVSIYYVGGVSPDEPRYANMTDYYYNLVSMDVVTIFNTSTAQWTKRNVTGENPFYRNGHTLTLKPSTGEMILLGGTFPGNVTDFRQDYFYLLDTDSMTWYTRTLNVGDNLDYNVTEISDHSAILIGDRYLYVLFGLVPPGRATNTVRVLDVETWTWVTQVSAVQAPEDGSEKSQGSSDGTSAGTIAGAVVGSIAGVGLIAAAIVFFYLRRKRQSKAEQHKAREKGEDDPTDYKYHNITDQMSSPVSQSGISQVPHTPEETQVSRGAKFYGSEKPDGSSNDQSSQILVMTPVKPDRV